MNVLIADDENIVLNGLKHIIEWQQIGFTICDEAHNGEEAFEKILSLNPDLVLLDIRMPKLSGIEVVQKAIEQNYKGKFIILSGVSDFKFAQTAMRYGVDFYLTKPIDEEELEQAVITVRETLLKERKNQLCLSQYRTKAKSSILKDILLNKWQDHQIDFSDLHLEATLYEVISYENYNQNHFHTLWNFAELLRVTNEDNHSFDIIEFDQQKVVLLKGNLAISKFASLIQHYDTAPQKGSPFDSVFLCHGRKVSHIDDIHLSYQDVCKLSLRRFFCSPNEHVVGYTQLPPKDLLVNMVFEETAPHYAELFSNYIQAYNHSLIINTLKKLSDELYYASEEPSAIKHFLTDIYILVKQRISQVYRNVDIPFPTNASVIHLIGETFYLYEIISFLAEQFEFWMHAVGYSSVENVIDEVLYYIQNNYHENIKLETIAPLFGYNSSYLGKIFNKKLGMNFKTYMEHLRINESKKLLEAGQLKVYEVAEQVGYNNVDYFHKKFKKYVGISPAEYRKGLD